MVAVVVETVVWLAIISIIVAIITVNIALAVVEAIIGSKIVTIVVLVGCQIVEPVSVAWSPTVTVTRFAKVGLSKGVVAQNLAVLAIVGIGSTNTVDFGTALFADALVAETVVLALGVWATAAIVDEALVEIATLLAIAEETVKALTAEGLARVDAGGVRVTVVLAIDAFVDATLGIVVQSVRPILTGSGSLMGGCCLRSCRGVNQLGKENIPFGTDVAHSTATALATLSINDGLDAVKRRLVGRAHQITRNRDRHLRKTLVRVLVVENIELVQ